MRIPSLNQAIQFIKYAEDKNPGPWVAHSFNAAKAAKSIANECTGLDGEIAYILALLHDIGRYEGFKKLHHAISGYNFLNEKGYVDAARIALTHSFVIPDMRCHDGDTDCSKEEMLFIQNYLNNVTYNDYDKLIHFCDAIVLPEGLCLMEKSNLR